ncbi:MAG: LuxR C-terminal-related transcriptional regulator [Actinomycetota bacterium]|nr:LuxR C-terminal-related transcriptional regulator [Actinomycetota bacterium]
MTDVRRLATGKPFQSFDAADFADGGLFRDFFDASGLHAARLDDKLRIVEVSVDFGEDFGRPVDELRGRMLSELLHPSVQEQIAQRLGRLLDGRRDRLSEHFLGLRGSTVFAGELTGLAVYGVAGLADGVVLLLRPEAEQRSAVVVGRKPLLSRMEARILEGVAAGASTIQLAGSLHLSCGGVEYHLTALLRALKVRNRSALVSKAYSMGLFCVGSWPPRVLGDFRQE